MNSQIPNSKLTPAKVRSYFAPRVRLPQVPRALSLLLRLLIAVFLVAGAAAIKFALDPYFGGRAPFLLFFGAVALSAWFGGFGAGALATFLSAFVNLNLIKSSPEMGVVWTASQIALFAIESLAISHLIQRTKNAQIASEAHAFELEASENRYRQVLDTAFHGIWILNPQAETVYTNEHFATMMGYTREEIQGALLYKLLPDKDHEIAKLKFEQRREGIREQYELQMRRKDGSLLWVQTSSTPLHSDSGEFQGTMAMLSDISDRQKIESALKQSEERYRAFVAHSTEAIWRFETAPPLDTRWPVEKQVAHCYEYSFLAECNDAMAKMHGFNKAEEITGARLKDFLPQTPENMKYLRAFIENDYRLSDAESREYAGNPDIANRPRKYFSNNLIGLRENDLIHRAWGVQRDITLQKEIETQRARLLEREQIARADAENARLAAENAQYEAERAREEAQNTSRAKDQFLATLSHELRTPLNSIMGWSQLLNEENLDEETVRYALSAIERNAKLQAQLVEDLLDISRITMGRMQIEKSPILFHQVIENAIQTVLPAAKARETYIEYSKLRSKNAETDDFIEDDFIEGDASRLQQAICNLLSNAIKFTPEHGKICVTQSRRENCARLEISDNGKGIEAHVLPHVFEAFLQADSSSTRAHGGVGLGLNIVKNIVDLHGGSVKAQSDGADLGATFIIELPLLETPVL